MINLELPWPPTLNHYYVRTRGKTIVSKAGKVFRRDVCTLCVIQRAKKIDGRLSLTILAYPPDNRKRDLGNLEKALGDALTHAGVYDDDSQIDELIIRRRGVIAGGKLMVTIESILKG